MAPSTGGEDGGSFLAPLPDHLLSHVLCYLDGNSLARWPQISKSAPKPRDEVWGGVARAEYSWLYPTKPSCFEHWRDFYLALRIASYRQQDLSAARNGGVWVLGGCDLGRDEPVADVTLLPDVGGAKVAGEGYPVPLWTASMPEMMEPRSALGVTRDLDDRIVAVGGECLGSSKMRLEEEEQMWLGRHLSLCHTL